MDFIIKDRKRNDLLKRDEIAAIVKSEVTPSMNEAKKAIAENLHADIEMVVVRKIKGKFGSKEFNVEALIYENKEAMQQTEPKPKARKEEEKPQAEGKAVEKEGKKPEGKTEEKAEQKKEEKAEQKSSK